MQIIFAYFPCLGDDGRGAHNTNFYRGPQQLSPGLHRATPDDFPSTIAAWIDSSNNPFSNFSNSSNCRASKKEAKIIFYQ